MPRRVLCAVGAVLLTGLAGCDLPQAWTDYMDPAYSVLDEQTTIAGSGVAIEVSGSISDVPQEQLRGLIQEALKGPPGVASSTPVNPGRRVAWTLSSANEGPAITAHARAEYYRAGTLITSAEGKAVLRNGAQDPNLRTLLDDVAAQLFPVIPHRGAGHG